MKQRHGFNTDRLDQILSDRRGENEEKRQFLLHKLVQWLDHHGLNYGISSAYIFGSLSRPYGFHQGSDIDVAVEQINDADFFAVIGFISEAMGRDVDVVKLHTCPFSDRIKQSGIKWTATSSSS